MSAVLSPFETIGLYSVIAVAVGALIYALILRREVLRESTGSGKVKEVWNGIKSGANAYLKTQFRSLILFIGVLGAFLYISAALDPSITNVQNINPFFIIIGRVGAFLIGVFFSWRCRETFAFPKLPVKAFAKRSASRTAQEPSPACSPTA
jgi:Na+/H+-translocating membrane pyrophosphatase